ncbi:hypothetical protein B296_00034216 [Ensete ventricosum]|uniref:Uncharacterized protein n=1 Tax=Ensete ventricosum TaxID=4639 RepID=A0A426YQR2_ENSVE|nr:hypothetical protein B296_00034216 [Ensete ventricosum]
MSDLGYQDPDKEMKATWRGLKNSTKIWNDSSAAEEFERGLIHPQLARELYTLPSDVLLARAAIEMVLELDALKSEWVWRRSPRPRNKLPSWSRSSGKPSRSRMKRFDGSRPSKRS